MDNWKMLIATFVECIEKVSRQVDVHDPRIDRQAGWIDAKVKFVGWLVGGAPAGSDFDFIDDTLADDGVGDIFSDLLDFGSDWHSLEIIELPLSRHWDWALPCGGAGTRRRRGRC